MSFECSFLFFCKEIYFLKPFQKWLFYSIFPISVTSIWMAWSMKHIMKSFNLHLKSTYVVLHQKLIFKSFRQRGYIMFTKINFRLIIYIECRNEIQLTGNPGPKMIPWHTPIKNCPLVTPFTCSPLLSNSRNSAI